MDVSMANTPESPPVMTPEHTSDAVSSPQSAAIERDVLVSKLQNIPTDVLRNILANQVDLEIRLKHKELALTEEEIGKCEAQMLALRQFLEVPSGISFRNEPNDFTVKYYDVLNKTLSVNYTKLQKLQYSQEHPVLNETMFSAPAAHSYRTRSTTSSLRPSVGGPAVRVTGCLYRRTDGVIVKLTCPDCQRSNFSSAQGFLNHSRIAHSKEYTSQDAAAISCGEVLHDEFQDEEGLASLASLKQKNVDPSRNLSVSEMYFDGLSQSLNTVHQGLVGSDVSVQIQSGAAPHVKVKEKSKAAPQDEAGKHELMKRLIKSGVAHDADEYKKMVEEMRGPVANAHLFDDEEEVEGGSVEAPQEELSKHKGKGVSVNKPVEAKPEDKSRANSMEEKSRANSMEEKRASSVEKRNEVGGKYENRLRRRKSRAESEEVDEEGKSKRRKSQR